MLLATRLGVALVGLVLCAQSDAFLRPISAGLITKRPDFESTRFRLETLRGGYLNDASVSMLVLGESVLWLKIWTTVAKEGLLDSKITRKIIHSGSAPLFMAHWPLYSAAPGARLFAALVPLLQVVRLYLAGTRTADEASELVAAVSRTGNKTEALGGPLIYSLVLLLATSAFFRDSAVGIVAVSQMAAGDGIADIFGRRYGKTKWPFAPTKSLVGSTAFVVGGFVVSTALLALMNHTGVLAIDVVQKAPVLLGISLLSAAVELLPIIDDNISVPLVAALATWLLL
ncbi:hypothetical protein B484DRAFT_391834 [Ochromonadaceae sp. CCMP2298]|nr:hypothetical protein B484DRAFT_391834 [Ochromonadaceae sp. CCMP2298]